ncbi:rhomboid family domain-containing protein, putative [Eimeria tenella]|uniref:Rhomboid-like protease n=1 Tax=Eimeria tenella TaxID=5802 RepID=U6KR27_EIMTE|nr:rhomboid family domain-containing protein, putative [Eimeria tenella]AVD66332.1 rhomboid protease 1 [Eimeria tenella]CDJ40567.1 rhomboid family domain-containing protein, putative [Eimeria tenella]|eukprot:XP_013231317.1 rhomboid family domain-containing protein, putative [Eimeria tenella]
MVVRTLADLRKEDEQRNRDAETGEALPLIRAETRSTDSSISSGGSASVSRTTALRVLDLLFPYFRLRSLLLLISVADWVVFITTLALDSEMPLVPSIGILVTFGANVPPLVAKGQVWRLLTASFLHANLLHVAFNVFFQLRMGFGIERRYGYLKFALLYAAAAIYGNLLSAAALFCGTVKVGASTAGFGMMGVEMAELALSWRRLQHRDRLLTNIISFFLLMGLFAFTLNGGYIDQMGHLGGLICGLSLGFLYNKDMQDKPRWWSFAMWCSVFLLVALPASCVPVIFAVNRGCTL